MINDDDIEAIQVSASFINTFSRNYETSSFPDAVKSYVQFIEENQHLEYSISSKIHERILTIIKESEDRMKNTHISLIMGMSYFHLKKYEDAVNQFNKVLESDPNNINAYVHRSRSYEQMHLLENALSDLTQAVNFNLNNAQIYAARANIYAKL